MLSLSYFCPTHAFMKKKTHALHYRLLCPCPLTGCTWTRTFFQTPMNSTRCVGLTQPIIQNKWSRCSNISYLSAGGLDHVLDYSKDLAMKTSILHLRMISDTDLIRLAYVQLYQTMAHLFRPGSPRLHLHATEEHDVKPVRGLLFILPREDARGLRLEIADPWGNTGFGGLSSPEVHFMEPTIDLVNLRIDLS